MKTHSTNSHDWLEHEKPDIYHLIRAIGGDADSQQWLEVSSKNLGRFAKAMTGNGEALVSLRDAPDAETVDLVGMVALSNGIEHWLEENHPEVHTLFSAIQGDDDALGSLCQSKSVFAELADAVRPHYLRVRHEDSDEGSHRERGSGSAGFEKSTAADVGCLVGEMHLREGAYQKAIEAFSRAIDKSPTADAFAGRARAYHALCQADEVRAQQLAQA